MAFTVNFAILFCTVNGLLMNNFILTKGESDNITNGYSTESTDSRNKTDDTTETTMEYSEWQEFEDESKFHINQSGIENGAMSPNMRTAMNLVTEPSNESTTLEQANSDTLQQNTLNSGNLFQLNEKIHLHIMGFGAISVNKNGWSSAGVLPAIEMAIEDVNARPDLLPEYKLMLDMKDSQCNQGKAIQGFFEHISTPPTKIVILGGGCSVSTVPVARTAPYFGLVQMGYSTGSPELSQRAFYPTFFRTAMSDLAVNRPIIRLLQHYNWRHIATIHEQDDMFSMTINQLHFLLTENNITLLTAESFQITPVENIRNILRKDARIIVFNGYEGSARLVFCQAYRQEAYGPKFQWIIPGWYNADWTDTNDTICTMEQVREAALYAMTVTDLKGDLSGLKTISGQTYEEYEARYLNWPSISEYGTNDYHTNGYDAVWAIALALNVSAKIISSQNQTELINGTIHVRPRRLDDFRYIDTPEISAVIFASLTEIHFHGVSGPVSFDLGERNAMVQFQQIQEEKIVRFAVYSGTINILQFIEGVEVKWHGDGPPKSALEPTLMNTYKNNILVICACVLAGVGAVIAILVLAFNIRNREHAHIKMSSPRLNNLIILGAILGYSCVVLFGLDGQYVKAWNLDEICIVRTWVFCIAFTLLFGAMFAKTWRVHVIFTRKFSLTTKPVHDVHLIGFVMGLLLLDVGLLTTWTVVNPFELSYRNISTVELNDWQVVYQLGICCCDNFWWWFGSVCAFKGLLLVFGCFLAWETRNVVIPGFNDSKYIGMSVYNVVIMCLVGVTVSLVLPERYDICYAFQAFCLLFCTYTTLSILFIPKIRHVLKHPEESAENRKASVSTTFKYTVESIRRKNGVSKISGNQTRYSDPSEEEDNISIVLQRKSCELVDLQRKYQQLEQTLKDMIISDNSPPLGENGVHLNDLPTAQPTVRRTASFTYPLHRKLPKVVKRDKDQNNFGFDNVALEI